MGAKTKELLKIPEHIAIIMDGNGRWAKKRGLPRLAGHKAGVEVLRDIIETGGNLGVSHMTFYAFSTENWARPADEVKGLMSLLVTYLRSETKRLHKNGIRLCALGDVSKLPIRAQKELAKSMELTEKNTTMTVHMALNYGGRQDILQAVKKIAKQVEEGKIESENISEEHLSKNLYTQSIPDPDLLIRTSGEERLSNFLLWQIAYTEFYFTNMYWPDFNGQALKEALKEYTCRDRRFGNVKG